MVLKGVLHPAEAKAAIDHGVDAVIVSNHGGRQLDGVPTSIARCQRWRRRSKAVFRYFSMEVFAAASMSKALALGAQTCLIGHPQFWGVATAGEAGVAQVLEIYRREIERVMGLCGATRIADIGPDLIFSRPRC